MFLPERLVCIDFEATCEKDDKNYYNEIIEFPSILIDTKKKTVISEFHRFVRPTVNPILSKFCVELTHVTQENIDSSDTFGQVLSEFEAWLRANNAYDASRTAIICDGVWDIQKFISIEFQKLSNLNEETKHLFSRWINCKDIFRSFCRGSRLAIRGGLVTISSMLENLGLRFKGQLHCGMDDTKNLSTIILELLKRGGQKHFKITNRISFATSAVPAVPRPAPAPNDRPSNRSALKKDSIMNDATSEIRSINKALQFDAQHNPLSMHNRFQLYHFKGSLNQLRATFGNIQIVDSTNAPVTVLVEACGHRDRAGDFPSVKLRSIDTKNLTMHSIFGYDDTYEYDSNFEQQKISFQPDGGVEFHRACLRGQFADVKRAINNSRLNQWNSLIQIQLAVPRKAKLLRSEPFPSPTSLENLMQAYQETVPYDEHILGSYSSHWAQIQQDGLERLSPTTMDPKIFCRHIFKKSKRFRKSEDGTKLEPPNQPCVGDCDGIAVEAAWICWRRALLQRRNELHALRRKRRHQVLKCSAQSDLMLMEDPGQSSDIDEDDDIQLSPMSSSPASPPESRLFGALR